MINAVYRLVAPGMIDIACTEPDLKKMLGVYFEQNVTTEKFEDFDGDRWVIVGE